MRILFLIQFQIRRFNFPWKKDSIAGHTFRILRKVSEHLIYMTVVTAGYIHVLTFLDYWLFCGLEMRVPISSKKTWMLKYRSSHWGCSLKIMFFFARSSYCGDWLTCSGSKGYSHRRLFFSQAILSETKTGLLFECHHFLRI